MAIFNETYISNHYDNFKYIGESVIDSIFGYDTSDVEISAEQIRELCETFNPDGYYSNLSYINEAVSASAPLSKIGIKGADGKINSAGKDIANTIKKEGITSSSRKKIHNRIGLLFDDLCDSISKGVPVPDSAGDNKPNIIKSLKLFIWVLTINTLTNTVLVLLVGPKIGLFLTAVIVAPLVEEASKSISVKGKFEKEYYVIFNAFEASMYISSMTKMGYSLGKAVAIRIAPALMHGVNTIIHKIFDSEKVRRKYDIGDDEDARNKATTAGYIITVLVHSTWNFVGSITIL